MDFVDRFLHFASLDEKRPKIGRWVGKICVECDEKLVEAVMNLL